MRSGLDDLNGRHFDVVVVGAGANGASAAQQITARGYSVLLVDKGDFASGTSSRSSRLLACGIQYLVPEPAYAGKASWRSRLSYPLDMLNAFMAARQTMQCRTQLVRETGARLRPATFFHPIYEDSSFSGWQVDIGFRLLGSFGVRDVPLNYRRLNADDARSQYPMVKRLGRQDKLRSVAVYQEYQYNWPERICVDAALDAQRMGATVRNYTAVRGVKRDGERWEFELEDARDASRAQVSGTMFVNTTGPWIDQVNSLSGRGKRHVAGIKGINVLVKLPDDCEGFGIECFNSIGQHFFAMPWGRYHFFGPTVAPYDGDPDKVRVNEDELEYVIREANYIFPSAGLTRESVVYAWAGVRPRTHYDGVEVRRRSSVLHDLESEGMPNTVALTEGPIMLHRHAGTRIAEHVARKIRPSRVAQPLSFAPVDFPEPMNSPLVTAEHPEVRVSDLRHAVTHQQATNLSDLLFRRVKLGWNGDMGLNAAREAARSVADLLGWDDDDIEAEVERYRQEVRDNFVASSVSARP
ncbi:MAG: FAD-dependent oxidoreductase [Pseudorhodoplanes sp.]